MVIRSCFRPLVDVEVDFNLRYGWVSKPGTEYSSLSISIKSAVNFPQLSSGGRRSQRLKIVLTGIKVFTNQCQLTRIFTWLANDTWRSVSRISESLLALPSACTVKPSTTRALVAWLTMWAIVTSEIRLLGRRLELNFPLSFMLV